jgi:hypothetical protein
MRRDQAPVVLALALVIGAIVAGLLAGRTDSTQAALAERARAMFGDSLVSATVNHREARVVYLLEPLDSEDEAVRLPAEDFRRFAPEVFAIGSIDYLRLVSRAQFETAPGVEQSGDVMRLAIGRDAAARINWATMQPSALADLLRGSAGDFYIEPSLQYAWDLYRGGW